MSAKPNRSAVHRGSQYPKHEQMVLKATYALDGIVMGLQSVNVEALDESRREELSKTLGETLTALEGFRLRLAGEERRAKSSPPPEPPTITTDPLPKIRAEIDLQGRERSFHARRNPLDAWFAYLTAREAGMPIPEWVLSYLDAGAERFRDLCRHSSDTESPRGRAAHTVPTAWRNRVPDDVRPAVAEALGFKRSDGKRGNAFLSVDNDELLARDLALAFAVDRCLQDRKARGRNERGDEGAYAEVADEFRSVPGFSATSRSTVARAWAKYKPMVEEFRSRG